MSWEAADIVAAISCGASVTEVLMRCRAVKAAAAAADCDRVVAWGGSCVKMAGNVLGNESEAVRLLRVQVGGVRASGVVVFFTLRAQVDEALAVSAGHGSWS